MNINDLRIYGINASAMLISFTRVESALKVLLLLASIVYTVMKIIELSNKNEADK